jgi:hypothetical protein
MRTRRRFASPAGPLLAQADAPDRGTLLVTMGDGATVTLRNWALSYEYSAYKQGASPMTGASRRTDSADLLVGKRTVPTRGQVLTFTYDEVPKALVAAGAAPATDRFKHPREVVVTGADGKKQAFKVEAPARDLLVPTAEKGMAFQARTLDLRGETITGTRKEMCLLSYTASVECGSTPPDAVVKVEFQR